MTQPQFRTRVYDGKNGQAVLFFCPFSLSIWQFNLPGMPIWRLRKAGFTVIAYDYPLAVAIESPQRTIDYLRAVTYSAQQHIARLKQKGIQQWSTYGISVGAIFAVHAAAELHDVENVVLNVPPVDIARHVDELPLLFLAPPWIRNRYVRRGGGAQAVRELFAAYTPINHATALADKRVLLCVAKKDRIVAYRYSRQFLRTLERVGADVTYEEASRGQHFWVAFRNNLRGDRIVDFLAKSSLNRYEFHVEHEH